MTKEKSASAEAKPAKKKRLFTIVGATVLLVGTGAGAGAYFGSTLIGGDAEAENHNPKLVLRSKEHVAEGEEGKEAPRVGTVTVPNDHIKADPQKYQIGYHPIADSFTTNLADGSGFLQVGISLSTYYDDQVIANIKRQSVPIRSAVLMVLAEQDPAFLSTSQGKQRLQRQLTASINDVLRSKEGFGGIDNVYFTNLVIQ